MYFIGGWRTAFVADEELEGYIVKRTTPSQIDENSFEALDEDGNVIVIGTEQSSGEVTVSD